MPSNLPRARRRHRAVRYIEHAALSPREPCACTTLSYPAQARQKPHTQMREWVGRQRSRSVQRRYTAYTRGMMRGQRSMRYRAGRTSPIQDALFDAVARRAAIGSQSASYIGSEPRPRTYRTSIILTGGVDCDCGGWTGSRVGGGRRLEEDEDARCHFSFGPGSLWWWWSREGPACALFELH